ncbi:protein max [Aplysia californica]|uniref:Protein max n=1 Tax=Aplysia californica TaxID=6500 RepID=A0ABM0K180_APLCA|nr:protein max [Aplysia californica]XP_035827766.1 protein max [Aplysia californica]
MSDEDREIDIESDADDEECNQTFSSDDKRAHHNALERKRRDHIKDSFHSLRDCVPQDDSKANTNSSSKTSRAQILRQAAEYIIRMRDKTTQSDKHIQILKQQNDELHAQIKALQKSQGGKSGHGSSSFLNDHHGDEDYESYEEETVVTSPPTKKKKTKATNS